MADIIDNFSILSLDKDGKILNWNTGTETIYGYQLHELIGQNFKIFYSTEDQQKMLPEKLMQEARDNPKATSAGWRRKKDGTVFWTDVTLTALYDNENELVGFSKISHDITKEQKQKEFENSNLTALINNTRGLMWSVDRNYKLITANKAFNDVVKMMSGKSIEKGDDVLDIMFPEDQLARYKQYYDKAFAGEPFTEIEYTPIPQNYWTEISFYPILTGDVVTGTACYAHDITRQKLDEQKIVHANRLYAFISQINQTIVRVKDEEHLYNEACRIAIQFGKFKTAWIGLLNHENKTVKLVAQRGMMAEDIHLFANATYDQPGPTKHILTTGTPFICNNVQRDFQLPDWKRFANTHSINSAIVLPIRRAGKTIGNFNMYSDELNYFNDEEVAMLEEVTGDLSFALSVFEKEKAREEAEKKLMHNEFKLKQAQEMAHFGNWSLDFSTGIATWSEEACRIYGLQPDDNLHTYESWLTFIHPVDLNHVMEITRHGEATLSGTSCFHRIVRRDGVVRHIHSQTEYEFRDGKPVGLYGVAHDITEQTNSIIRLKAKNKQLRDIADIQSHEVRGPLATILGLAQLINSKEAGINTEEILEGILASSQKLDKVVREIVDKTAETDVAED